MFRTLHPVVAWSSPFLFVLLVACGGGKNDDKDDDEPSLRWQCYADTSFGTCECYGIEPGSSFYYEGSSIVEVDECSGYAACFSYFDTFFEEKRCDCGDEGFMPFGPAEDISDLTMVEACPAE